MKKLVLGIICSMALMCSATAFASEAAYDADAKSVSTDANVSKYRTVIITKNVENVSDADIVYVNQANRGFDAGMDFMFSQDVEAGEYKLTLGGSDDLNVIPFTIGAETKVEDEAMRYIGSLEKDGAYSVGFVAEEMILSGYNSIKVMVTEDGENKVLGYSLADLLGVSVNGEGAVSFGLQIDGVPSGCHTEDVISVYLSADPV